jgi:hypothetical protein
MPSRQQTIAALSGLWDPFFNAIRRYRDSIEAYGRKSPFFDSGQTCAIGI